MWMEWFVVMSNLQMTEIIRSAIWIMQTIQNIGELLYTFLINIITEYSYTHSLYTLISLNININFWSYVIIILKMITSAIQYVNVVFFCFCVVLVFVFLRQPIINQNHMLYNYDFLWPAKHSYLFVYSYAI